MVIEPSGHLQSDEVDIYTLRIMRLMVNAQPPLLGR